VFVEVARAVLASIAPLSCETNKRECTAESIKDFLKLLPEKPPKLRTSSSCASGRAKLVLFVHQGSLSPAQSGASTRSLKHRELRTSFLSFFFDIITTVNWIRRGSTHLNTLASVILCQFENTDLMRIDDGARRVRMALRRNNNTAPVPRDAG
jgi:hypothetical protein